MYTKRERENLMKYPLPISDHDIILAMVIYTYIDNNK